jgi:REP element-mobilizing transposase RayT
MPRSTRLDAPGVLNHVIIRGIECRRIFFDERDRHDLRQRLAALIPATGSICYAWALMGNHAHFLFRAGPCGLASLMRRLLTGYAVTFYHRYKRHGQPLFQSQYKSIICEEDSYLKGWSATFTRILYVGRLSGISGGWRPRNRAGARC